MHLRYFFLWLPMIGIAFLNAGIREIFIVKYVEPFKANQLSVFTLIVFCGLYAYAVVPKLQIHSIKAAFFAGGLWVILTVLLEFSLGLAMGKTMPELLKNYFLWEGFLWPMYLLFLLFLPLLCMLIRKWKIMR